MKKNMVGSLFVGALMITGCSASKPDALYHAESELQLVKNDDFTYQHAPLVVREAEKTLVSAQTAWREDRDAQRTEALALLTEEQLDAARVQARQKAMREVHEDISQKEELLQKDRKLQKAKKDTKELYQVASHYQYRSKVLEKEKGALLKELQAKETELGLEITLGSDVLFETDAFELKPGGKRSLEPLAAFLQKHPDYEVSIEGHTDSTGDFAYNRQLSGKRADAVKSFLIRKGIEETQIKTLGMGEGYPVATNDSDAGRLQNRRVEIVVSDE